MKLIKKSQFNNLNLLRVATISPKIHLGNISKNVSEISGYFDKLQQDNVDIAVFPELTLTGYTIGDLVFQRIILENAKKGLIELINRTKSLETIIIVGLPFEHRNKIFNAAATIHKGELIGLTIKTHLSNSKEYYEERWFTSARDMKKEEMLSLPKEFQYASIGSNLIFEFERPIEVNNENTISKFNFGVEICEDLWAVNPPSNDMALSGAEVIFNLSTSSEVIGKANFRRDLVRMQSAKTFSAYVYCSSNSYESSTDLAFAGHNIIAENGRIVKENKRFDLNGSYMFADLDLDMLRHDRSKNHTFARSKPNNECEIITSFVQINKELQINDEINKDELNNVLKLEREIAKSPFVPNDAFQRKNVIEDILEIQSNALISKLIKINKDINTSKIVVGVSGGLDSTLALLIAKMSFDRLGIYSSNIYAITMPGFGTTSRTYNNAINLARYLSLTILEIPIKDAVEVHFRDIKHDENNHNIVYENAQARERTQILMDYANKVGGIVLGTGDLSELALGWCTYNADHISMYNVNGGVPKTLVKEIVRYFAEIENLEKIEFKVNDNKFTEIINDIVNTEVSPELLPNTSDKISQKTEDIIGPYELIDFYMFYLLRYGFAPSKILIYAEIAFEGLYTQIELKKWLKVFISRFFTNQYKRNLMPDTVKIGSIALSPRGDWRMPSELDFQMWLDDLESN